MRRHGPSDEEWAIIEPLSQKKPRGVPRVDDRRVINGILCRFRTGAPWRDVPERYGPCATLYDRFSRWRAAGVWDRLFATVSEACDGDIVVGLAQFLVLPEELGKLFLIRARDARAKRRRARSVAPGCAAFLRNDGSSMRSAGSRPVASRAPPDGP